MRSAPETAGAGAVLYGLVLAGGQSRRMRRDKALLDYHGRPQVVWAYELIAPLCRQTYVSVARDQADGVRDALPRIVDRTPGLGPAGGMLAAHAAFPEAAWLVVAVDLPFLDEAMLRHLLACRDPSQPATAFRSAHDGLPEPLCAVWEPAGLALLGERVAAARRCPRKALIESGIDLLEPHSAVALDNVNTPDEHSEAAARLDARPENGA